MIQRLYLSMQLSEIWIYPVKSLGGIRLSEALVEERGLQYDRRWMVVDENGIFLTQRTYLKMALIDVSIEQKGIVISRRNQPENNVLVPFEPVSAKKMQVKVWDDLVQALTVCDEADAWLSTELDIKVRLVFMPDTTERKADPRYALNDESVSFADGFPFLIISQASLNDLNSRLTQPMEMRRFRPNFVVTGSGAFEEDAWKTIQIGEISFDLVKPCNRCVLTTINPETGEKGIEPLKTLATYRREKNKVLFGMDMIAKHGGTVKQGDPVIQLR